VESSHYPIRERKKTRENPRRRRDNALALKLRGGKTSGIFSGEGWSSFGYDGRKATEKTLLHQEASTGRRTKKRPISWRKTRGQKGRRIGLKLKKGKRDARKKASGHRVRDVPRREKENREEATSSPVHFLAVGKK